MKLFPAAGAILLFAASPAFALQDPQVPPAPKTQEKRTVPSTVEFSFVFPVNHDVLDPVGLARFQLSLESLLHGTLDDAVAGAGGLAKGAFFLGVMMLDRTVAKVGHEYGHTAVFNRAGYKDFLLTVGNQDPEPLTFHEVFINSLVPARNMSIQLREEDAQDALARFSSQAFQEFSAISFAGGLNQEQVHLNLYRERVLRHQFGFFDTSTYLIESLSTLAYSGAPDADLDGYVDSLESAGFTTSIGAVKALSVVRFLSGSAISAGLGFYKVMSQDKYDGFAPRVIGGGKDWTVLWPEFESFLTRRGPTVRASLPVRALGWTVIQGLETAFAEEGLEFEWGIEASRPAAPWLDVRGSMFLGTEGGSWAEAGIAVKPVPSLSFLASWHVGHGYTFHRDVYGETFDFEERTETGLQLGFSAIFKF